MEITINCDMGEGYGRYRIANDTELMPYVNLLNVACGFHASDPSIMHDTVMEARRAGVRVGAHPSLPDRQGFGRREMAMSPAEVAAVVRYQVGALTAFLDLNGLSLSHVKPHGALFAMASRNADIANAICDAVAPYRVPILGLAGTYHESVCAERGCKFIGEFYGDLEYDDDGGLIYAKVPPITDSLRAANRVEQCLRDGTVQTASGRLISVSAESICIHSDGPNAIELLRAIRRVVDSWNSRKP